MKTIKGDLIKLFKKGEFDVIVHGCNCLCVFGAGIAKQIKEQFPEAYEVDKQTKTGCSHKLGNISVCQIGEQYIINAYTQYTFGTTKRNVDYEAIRSCFRKIKEKFSGKRIGYPQIGAGLGGGDWGIIKLIIDCELDKEDHSVVIYK